MRGNFPFAAAAALLLACAMSAPSAAQTAVDLQLVLAVDASGSVDQIRFDLQKRGYVAAFRHARVLQAIRSGPNQAIAVTMVQWTGPMMQVQVAEWSAVGDEPSAAAFAAAIERVPRQLFGGGTSISGAIDFSATLFPKSPFRAPRRVIDVSGDGSNNSGPLVTLVRDDVVASGITINGLPIMLKRPNSFTMDLEHLDVYYEDCVIGGPGAFVIPIRERSQFKEAIRTKLVLEVAGRTPEGRVIPAQGRAPRISCTIGEQMWRERWGN